MSRDANRAKFPEISAFIDELRARGMGPAYLHVTDGEHTLEWGQRHDRGVPPVPGRDPTEPEQTVQATGSTPLDMNRTLDLFGPLAASNARIERETAALSGKPQGLALSRDNTTPKGPLNGHQTPLQDPESTPRTAQKEALLPLKRPSITPRFSATH